MISPGSAAQSGGRFDEVEQCLPERSRAGRVQALPPLRPGMARTHRRTLGIVTDNAGERRDNLGEMPGSRSSTLRVCGLIGKTYPAVKMTVTLTINGQRVQAADGSTILEAARANGIRIPTLCHHPDLTNVGACRLCVVSVERARGLQTACTTPVFDGMVVQTRRARMRAPPATLRAQRAAHRPPERLHAVRGQRRVRAAGPRLRVRRRVAGPRRRAARVPARSGPQPVHLHRPQQVHPVHAVRPRVRRDPEPGRLGHLQPGLQEQARRGRGPEPARRELRELRPVRRPTARWARSTTR